MDSVFLPTDPPRPAPLVLTKEDLCSLLRITENHDAKVDYLVRNRGLRPCLRDPYRFYLKHVLEWLDASDEKVIVEPAIDRASYKRGTRYYPRQPKKAPRVKEDE